MWDIKQIITLKYRQCDKLSISRWSDVNAIFLAVPARKIATSNHLEIDSSSHHRILWWLFDYYLKSGIFSGELRKSSITESWQYWQAYLV